MEKAKKVKKKYTLFTGKQLLWLILPIIIEQIFSTSLGLVDSMMTSGLDIDGSAGLAVSNVDQINNLIIQLFSAFATGGAIITSQFLGANDRENANKSAKHMIIIVLLAATVISALCLALNWPLLKLFFGGVSASTFSNQQLYFYITAASFPFIGLFNACAALLRAQRKSIFTMVSAAISCVLNIGMNAIFLYVLKMYVVGAALATLICRAIPAVFMLCLLSNKKYTVQIHLFAKFRFDGKMVKKILHLAIPSGIESALFQLGKLLTFSFVNGACYVKPLLDENGVQIIEKGEPKFINIQANGNSIATNINNIASVVGGGVGTSCLTVIGQAVGTGDPDQCKYYMKKMFLISYIANSLCVGTILGLSPLLVRLYGYAPEAQQLGLNCLFICLAFQFVTYPLSFTTPAILKATSDVKYVMFSAIISMVVMRVGLCFVFTSDLCNIELGAYGFWIGMCSDWVLRSILFLARLLSGRWRRASGLLKEPAAATQAVGYSSGDISATPIAESGAAEEESADMQDQTQTGEQLNEDADALEKEVGAEEAEEAKQDKKADENNVN